jgi:hypothetical protein
MATIHWRTGTSGDWSQGSDWVGGVAPSLGDDAVVDVSGSYAVTISTAVSANSLTLNDSQATVTETATGSLTLAGTLTFLAGTFQLNAGTTTVGALTQSGGQLTGTGTLTASGTTALSAGVMEGGSKTTQQGSLLAQGTLIISGSYTALDGGWTLTADGTTNWTSGYIYFGYNPVGTTLGGTNTFVNAAGASFLDQNTAGYQVYLNSGTGIFSNAGLFDKTVASGSSTTTVSTIFNNSGTLEVDAGTVSLTGGGAEGGAITVAAGAVLGFDGGSFTLNNVSAISSSGTLRIGGGTVNESATLTNGGTLAITAGSLNASGTITTASFTQSGGSLAGTVSVTVSGVTALSAGGMEGGSKTVQQGGLVAQGALLISGSYIALDGGWTLTADGTTTWTSGTIYFGYNPVGTTLGGTNTFVNATGASFLDQNAAGYSIVLNSGTGVFSNAGLFDKTVASGGSTTQISTIFNNQSTGVLAVEAGTMSLTGTVTNSGVFEAVGGTLFAANAITGGGHLVVGTGTKTSEIELGGATSQAVVFNGTAATLRLDHASNYTGILSGFTAGDILNLAGTHATSATPGSFNGATTPLTVNLNTGGPLTFTLAGDYRTAAFSASFNGSDSNITLGAAPPTPIHWKSPVSGDWSIGSNWVGAVAPGPGNDAVIDVSGSYTVTVSTAVSANSLTLNDSQATVTETATGSLTLAGALTLTAGTFQLNAGTTTVGALTQSSGQLTGVGTVAVGGATALSAGAMEGGSKTAQQGSLLAQSTLIISGSYTALDGGWTLTADGTTNWTSGYIYFGYNPVGTTLGGTNTFVNAAGANFLDQNTAGYSLYLNSGTGIFSNAGLFDKTAASGSSTTPVSTVFNNSGTLEVDAGTVSLTGGGAEGGAITVAAGAVLGFDGGSFTLNNVSAISSSGTLRVGGGTVSESGTLSNGGILQISGGTLDAAGAIVTASFTQSGGSLAGTAAVTVSGTTAFSAGGMEGGSKTAQQGSLLAQGALVISGSYAALDGGWTLTADGTTNWTSGYIYFGYNPVGTTLGGTNTFVNAAGASFLDQNTANYQIFLYSGTGIFNNAGLFDKTAASGSSITTVSPIFNNSGTLEVDAGTVSLSGGGTETGAFTIAAGATLGFEGRSFALNNVSAISSSGTIEVGGGTVSESGTLGNGGILQITGGTLNAAGTIITANFTQSGGSLTGTAAVTVSGTTALSAGGMEGGTKTAQQGSLSAQGALVIAGSYTALDGGWTLTADGTTNWTSGYIYFGYNPVGTTLGGTNTFINAAGATFLDQNTAGYQVYLYSGTGIFDNAGLFDKTAASGSSTTTISTIFNNSGTLKVDFGTVSLTGGGTEGGALTVAAGAVLDFGGGSFTLSNASAISSSGTIEVGGGTVSESGSLTNGGTLAITGGILNAAGAIVTASYTQSGGSLAGTAAVTVSGTTALSAGGMEGGSKSVQQGSLLAQGTLIISGSYTALDGGWTLTADGTTNWTSGYIYFGYNPIGTIVGGTNTFVNAAGASFLDQNTAGYSLFLNSGTGIFSNAGLFDKTSASGNSTTTIATSFSNQSTGVLKVEAGTVSLTGATVNSGLLEALGGSLVVANAITGGGQLAIGTGGLIELGGATSETLTFTGTNGKLRLDAPATSPYTGIIAGFTQPGAILELANTRATRATASLTGSNTILTVTRNVGGPLTYTLAGDLTADSFVVSSANGGVDSDISVSVVPVSIYKWDVGSGTWNASSGADWNPPGDGSVPNSNSAVTIGIGAGGTVALPQDQTIDNLSITNLYTLSGGSASITTSGDASVATGGALILDNMTVGGTLTVAGTTAFNGVVASIGGITVSGTLTLTGGTIFASAIAGPGTIQTQAGTTATLNAVTIAVGTTYTASNGAVTDIIAAMINNGMILINGGSGNNGFLNLTGNVTLSGGGTLALSTANGGGNAFLEGSGQTLTNVGNAIAGTGIIGNGSLALVNAGAIIAGPSGGTSTLTLNGSGGVTNTGIFEAASGGLLDVTVAIAGAGQLEIGAGSEMELGGATNENATFLGAGNAKLRIDNARSTAFGGTIANFVPGVILELGSTVATSATPSLNGSNTVLTVDLSGGGTLIYNLAGNQTGDIFEVTSVNAGTDSDIAISTGTTLTGTYVNGLVLRNPILQNPTTLAATGYITNRTTTHGGDAVYGTNAAPWHFTNLGTVKATATTAAGIYLKAGGVVTNEASGSIAAYRNAVSIKGAAGTVANFGKIDSTNTVNAAVYLGAGGLVGNGASGATTATITSPETGISVRGGAGAVTNFGTVESTTKGTSGSAVYLGSGGTVTNYGMISGAGSGTLNSHPGVVSVRNQPGTVHNFATVASSSPNGSNGINLLAGGTILNGAFGKTNVSIAGSETGIYMGGTLGVPTPGALGFVDNYGLIQGTSGAGIFLASGGGVTNAASGVISAGITGVAIENASGTAVNYGAVVSTATGTSGAGVYLGAGGVVTNQASGAIYSSHTGVSLENTAGGVVNFGRVLSTATGTSGAGVYLGAGGYVANSGLIAADRVGVSLKNAAGDVRNDGMIGAVLYQAVYLGAGGSVYNRGVIGSASATHAAIAVKNVAGRVLNFGTIENTGGNVGIRLHAGGVIANGPLISGNTAVAFGDSSAPTSAPATLSNLGTVTGIVGIFVETNDTGANTVFNAGTIIGSGGTAIAFGAGNDLLLDNPGAVFSGIVDGGAGNNTLELVAGAATGTLSGLGTSFVNFATVRVDPGAGWQVSGASNPAPAFVNDGTVLVSGSALELGAVSQDSGRNGVIDVASSGVAEFQTMVAGQQTVSFLDATGTVKLGAPARFGATIAGFAQGDTIDLVNTPATRLVYSGGVLTVMDNGAIVAALTIAGSYNPGQFVLTSDGHGGNQITLAPGSTIDDFVFTYNDGKDYYYGTVADNGTYGYQVGGSITTGSGTYDIFSQNGTPSAEAAGAVFVSYYSHGGPGQASYTPQQFALGQPDGLAGLGSESDFILGTDGKYHQFSATAEATISTSPLYGFVFNYSGGAAYYSGTVADDGTYGYAAIAASASPYIPEADGYYYVFSEGTTGETSGTVVVNYYRDNATATTRTTDHLVNGVSDSSTGLGSETGYFFVNGTLFSFTNSQEATDPVVGPPIEASTTAHMLSRTADGTYDIWDIANNGILDSVELGQVGTDYVFAGLGNFNADDTADMILRNSNTGQFEVYDISNDSITAAAPLGQVGLDWQVAGFGSFGGPGGATDMMSRNADTGMFELYEINNNQVTSARALGQVGSDWQVAGFGDFNGDGTTDMMLRNANTGMFEAYDIANGMISSASTVGQVGLDWQVAGFGHFNGQGSTGMMLRNANTGMFEVYDIANNTVTSASSIGQVGLDWQVAGFGPFNGTDASDMALRNATSGAVEIYDIAGDRLVSATSAGQVDPKYQIEGFVPAILTHSG